MMHGQINIKVCQFWVILIYTICHVTMKSKVCVCVHAHVCVSLGSQM